MMVMLSVVICSLLTIVHLILSRKLFYKIHSHGLTEHKNYGNFVSLNTAYTWKNYIFCLKFYGVIVKPDYVGHQTEIK